MKQPGKGTCPWLAYHLAAPALLIWLVCCLPALAQAAGRHGSAGASVAPRHLVFAHYMVCFSASPAFYKHEIELAQRHGIDGFVLNCGAWLEKDPKTGKLLETRYVRNAERIYKAARELGTGFKLFFSADLSGLNPMGNMLDMVRRFHDQPNQFRYHGKIVISGYGGTPESYVQAVRQIEAHGFHVCLVPAACTRQFAMTWSTETVRKFFKVPEMDGLFFFACDDSVAGIIRTNAIGGRVTQDLGKIYMAGVCPAYNSANLRDFHGLGGYMAMWRGLIDDDADWVEIVTWNDYNEDSGLMPAHWPFGAQRYLYDRDESYLDATAYCSAWFKSGRRPKITQDKMFVTYRNRSKWLRRVWNGKAWVNVCLTPGSFDQIHDDVKDLVYIDTFLTAPARLTVLLGGGRHVFDMPAGIGHAEVPLVPGVPHLILQRDGKVLADVLGRQAIIARPTKRNSYDQAHLTNRTWCSGTAVGPIAQHLEAAHGKLFAGAAVVTQGGVTGVLNGQVKDSGFSVPVRGLKTCTYNVRITYRNPGRGEARLTLYADGLALGPHDYPYFIPAFLPPTGSRFETVSFFWSLYKTTTTLKLQWEPGQIWGKPDPMDDDYGRVVVAAIDLIAVQPPVTPAPRNCLLPTMVFIPGGKFMMGSNHGKPDERPVHPVTLRGFGLGKYEVTNEEFEQFDPAHRKLRDSFSWRNRAPVIYVSWVDGVRYCNWLSRRHSLVPAYRQAQIRNSAGEEVKTWVYDPQADGFHLPTEAQWEYEASGRGQNRKYPWGDAPLQPMVQGNFEGARALDFRQHLRASFAGGVTVVGSFPRGASRDGVMDMAGNVSEWCTDWYLPYAPEPGVAPAAHDYRSIRGGSWGYYGYSQRVRHREFNNPNYGGYVYIGLRVAINATGYRKLYGSNAR